MAWFSKVPRWCQDKIFSSVPYLILFNSIKIRVFFSVLSLQFYGVTPLHPKYSTKKNPYNPEYRKPRHLKFFQRLQNLKLVFFHVLLPFLGVGAELFRKKICIHKNHRDPNYTELTFLLISSYNLTRKVYKLIPAAAKTKL